MRIRVSRSNLSLERLWLIFYALAAGVAALTAPATIWWVGHRKISMLEGFFLLNLATLAVALAVLRLRDTTQWPISILTPARLSGRSQAA